MGPEAPRTGKKSKKKDPVRECRTKLEDGVGAADAIEA
jgi:hypothetical protein